MHRDYPFPAGFWTDIERQRGQFSTLLGYLLHVRVSTYKSIHANEAPMYVHLTLQT